MDPCEDHNYLSNAPSDVPLTPLGSQTQKIIDEIVDNFEEDPNLTLPDLGAELDITMNTMSWIYSWKD